jgi:gas vesicle protein
MNGIKGFIIGAVVGVLATIAAFLLNAPDHPKEAPNDALVGYLLEQGRAQRDSIARLNIVVAVQTEALAELERVAEPVIDKAKTTFASIAITPIDTATVPVVRSLNAIVPPPMDTVSVTGVARRGIDPFPWPTPTWFVETYQQAVGALVLSDSLNTLHRARWYAADVRAQMLSATAVSDSILMDRIRGDRDWWKAKKTPRCQVKCGIVLGVVGTVGVAIAAKKVGDLLERKP